MHPAPGINGKRSIRLLIVVSMTVLLAAEKNSCGQTFRILPLGNSITEGMDNTYPPESQRISYRKVLYESMTSGGYNFDFVGHDHSGYDLLSDADHGGIPGSRAQYVVRLLQDGYDLRNSVQITPGNQPYLDVWPADIVLLHIGTNDITHGEGSSADDMVNILNEIDAWEAASGNHVTVFVARILQRTDDPVRNQATIQLNNNVASLMAARGDPSIRMVDIESGAGINYITEMQTDGIHPLQTAYDKMGQKWFSALDVYLSALPAIPGDFTAGDVTAGSVQLTWIDNSDNESAFEIERAPVASGPFSLIYTAPANTKEYIDSGLTGNTTYYYRIRAINTTGPSLYSPVLNVTILPEAPEAPAGLTVGSPTTSSLQLNWNDRSDDETGFQIERSLTQDSGYTWIHTTAANVTTYVNTGLNDGTWYYYRIRATNGISHSAYSNEAFAETLPAPPDAPSNLATEGVTATSIELSWTDRSDSETGFEMERSFTPGGGFTLIQTLPADAVEFVDTSLSSMTTYYYRIRSINSAGYSSWSNEASGTTGAAPPEAPADLVVESPTTISLQLNWTDRSDNETGFQVERSLTPMDGFRLIFTTGANISFYVDIGLDDSTTYYYRVRAAGSGSFSSYSNTASGTTLLTPPDPPGNLAVGDPTSSTLRLNWEDRSDNESGFLVERSLEQGGGFAQVNTVAAGTDSYVDGGLEDETLYHYRIRAVNEAGASPWSNVAAGTTMPGVPAAPGKLTAAGTSSTSLELNWEDHSDNETGFLIERSFTPGSGFSLIHTAEANATSYINSGLEPGTEYCFRVSAVNSAGNSAYSNEAVCRTWPPSDEVPSDSLFSVFPNPTDGRLILKIHNPAELERPLRLVIAGPDGKRSSFLEIETGQGNGEQLLEIQVPPGQKSGLYTLILETGHRRAVKRILVLSETAR